MVSKRNKAKLRKKKEFEINVPWYAWALVVIVVAFVVFYVVFNGFGKVNYKGLVFEAEKYGDVIVYHYTYFFNNPMGETIKYNLYVQNNPNKNKVPLSANIVYPEYFDEVKLSINTAGLMKCSDSIRAIGMLSEFLTNNGFKIKAGTTNVSLAQEYNMTYITCETHPNDFVISISGGIKTQVVQDGNCFKIEASNCEIGQAVEKFIVESVVQARERTKG